MNDFQERLQELLDDNELNRLQLSKKLGISSTTINGYFNKNYYPEIKIAIKMAKYFNCSLDYLLGLTNEDIKTANSSTCFMENLDNLIKKKGLSKAKTLRELHMSEYNYFRWKHGKVPKTVNLIEIAKYFDVSIDYLIGSL